MEGQNCMKGGHVPLVPPCSAAYAVWIQERKELHRHDVHTVSACEEVLEAQGET